MKAMRGWSRREWLAGSGAALAGGACARRRATVRARVSLLRLGRYSQEIYEAVRRLLAEHRVEARGLRVVLKPNLVEYDPGTTINTHPLVVHAALEAFRELGAAEVRIAEGPGHRRNTLELAEAAGYFGLLPDFEVRFTDLNLDEIAPVRLESPRSKLRDLYLPRTALDCDLLVSLPKMKTHHWVGATLSMKNLFGLIPGAVYGWPKNLLHWSGISECIADLHRLLARRGRPRLFAIVDGIVGMEGNGPIQGTPKSAGVLAAGWTLPAVDAVCCRIMRIEPRKIAYLQMEDPGGLLAPEGIELIGEPLETVQTPFELIPQFRDLRL